MDAKLAKLIEILRDEGQISPAELARRLDVSVRTVRTYVSRANDLLARTDAQGGDGARPMVASRPEGGPSPWPPGSVPGRRGRPFPPPRSSASPTS